MKTPSRLSILSAPRHSGRRLTLTALLVLATGCAAPVFRNLDNVVRVAPADVQQSAQSFEGVEVLWGGRIVSLKRLEDSTRVEIIAYPLNRSRQPVPDAESTGRFILVVPGSAEPPDYTAGRHLTAKGVIAGIWPGQVEGRFYPFPVLQASEVNVWQWGFMFDTNPQISIGIGVGIGSQFD